MSKGGRRGQRTVTPCVRQMARKRKRDNEGSHDYPWRWLAPHDKSHPPTPRRQEDVFPFLSCLPGPRDAWRFLEDRQASEGLTLRVEALWEAGVKEEAIRRFCGGIVLETTSPPKVCQVHSSLGEAARGLLSSAWPTSLPPLGPGALLLHLGWGRHVMH